MRLGIQEDRRVAVLDGMPMMPGKPALDDLANLPGHSDRAGTMAELLDVVRSGPTAEEVRDAMQDR